MEDQKHEHITFFCQGASGVDCHVLVINVFIETYYSLRISAYLKYLIALYINLPIIGVS